MRALMCLAGLLAACSSEPASMPDAGSLPVDARPIDAGATDAPPRSHDAPPMPDAGPVAALPRVITSVAGMTAPHAGGARDVWILKPLGLYVAADGSLVFYDGGYNVIERIATDQNQTVTVLAGTFVKGDSGTGGPATAAALAGVFGGEIAPSPDGLIYVSDFANQRIKVVNPTAATLTACGGVSVAPGAIELVAGTGEAGFSGEGTSALAARLAYPRGIIVWRGDVVFADIHNQRVRRVVCATGVIETLAGNGDLGVQAMDGSVTAQHPDGSSDMVPDWGDGGPAAEAIVDFPAGLVIAPDGALLIGESGLSEVSGDFGRLRRVDASGTISTVAGNPFANGGESDSDATMAGLGFNGRALAFDAAGDLFIGEPESGRIRRIEAGYGKTTTIMGDDYGWSSSDAGGRAGDAHLGAPCGFGFRDGDLYFTDATTGRIRWLAAGPSGVTADSVVGEVGGSLGPKLTYQMAIDHHGLIVTAPNGEGRVLAVDRATGDYSPLLNLADVLGTDGENGRAGDARAYVLDALTFDEDDNLYFTEYGGGRLAKIAAIAESGDPAPRVHVGSTLTRVATLPFPAPDKLAVGGGTAYVSDPDSAAVYSVDLATGAVARFAGTDDRDGSGVGGPADEASFASVTGMALDVAHHALYVSDADLGRVWRIDTAGGATAALAIVTAYADCPQCSSPADLALFGGYLFVADNNFARVLRVDLAAFADPGALQDLIAGPGGDPGFVADEVPAAGANIEATSIAVDPDGKLYIGEQTDGRVRRVGTVDLILGSGDNHVHMRSTTPISVAFLSSRSFSAPDEIDQSTMRVAGAMLVRVAIPMDVDGDGIDDLRFEVRPTEMNLRPGQREVPFTATTRTGRAIVDADFVSVTDD